jgi:hypothetical protein
MSRSGASSNRFSAGSTFTCASELSSSASRCIAGISALPNLRLAESRLADNHRQLSVTLPRSFPPAHQHGDFFLATDERREVALPRAASAAACPNQSKQRHWLWHAKWLAFSSPRSAAVISSKAAAPAP